jgi:hypothetical protein
MSRKSTILALAAIVSLGSVALSTTGASAFGGHGQGGHGQGGGGMRMGGMGGMHVNNFHSIRGPGISFRRVVHVHPHWHHWHWRFGWQRPYWIAPVVTAGVATYAAPTWNRCTCLTKEYTQEGAVVFKDLCTKESAINPPDNPGATGDTGPQQPQQQGYLQPQAR